MYHSYTPVMPKINKSNQWVLLQTDN